MLFLIYNFTLKTTNSIFDDHSIIQHMHMKGIKYRTSLYYYVDLDILSLKLSPKPDYAEK